MYKISLKIVALLFFLLVSQLLLGQSVRVFGFVSNQNLEVVEGVSIEYKRNGTITDAKGYYSITIPVGKKSSLVFTHLSYENQVIDFPSSLNNEHRFDITLKKEITQISEVELIDEVLRNQNVTTLDKKNINVITGPTGGVEGLISTLAGVSTKNEMSSQYSVRGGNFDENLVYVNGFEIYRPFLVRGGEQEGLSFVNSDMVENITFSSGGFDAKYGDKLSSVLDIQYKDPKEWRSHLTLSFLGVNATVEGVSKSKRWSHITSYRQKTNQFLLNSLDTESNYLPRFRDFQSLNIFHFNSSMKLSLLAHYSSNTYQSNPQTRQSDFGTVDKPLRLNIYFEGQEKDAYESGMGAARFDYQIHDSLKMSLSASIFQTLEEEYYDVEAQYFLGSLDNSLSSDNFGEVVDNRGVGGYLRHARNDLFAQVYNAQYRGKFYKKKSNLEWGVKYQHELIDDRLKEWQLIDSSGFSTPQGLDTLLELFEFVQAENELNSSRYSAFVQQVGYFDAYNARFTYSLGLRSLYWTLNDEFFLSPRASLSYLPNWKRDVLFRASIGSYNQSPFYRELRNKKGVLFPDLNAQKSTHFVLSSDYNFQSWDRPFKFVGELYSSRYSAFVQQVGYFDAYNARFTYSLGVRSLYWTLNDEVFLSPRASLSYLPNWKRDVLFRASIGSYNQSPFYRELRNKKGVLFTDLNSQKSTHFVLSSDYNFQSWDRPFKFVGELYYKRLTDIIPYEIENLRIRYLPELSASGYTVGVDLRVNGEFVPGVESWASMSLLSSREDIENDGHGYIPRPTDQRFGFSMFFQDYLPNRPSYKMNLKLHYSSGLPTGALNSERHEQLFRIPSYKRVDIGFSKIVKQDGIGSKSNYLKHFDSLVLSLEIFNLLGIRNTISYLWVTDVVQNQYAVPNYLTSRLLNIKIQAKF